MEEYIHQHQHQQQLLQRMRRVFNESWKQVLQRKGVKYRTFTLTCDERSPKRVREIGHILPQSSGDFDPDAYLELKKPPDPSEILIRRNHFSIRKNYIKNLLEMIRSPPLLIRNDVLLIRGKMIGFPDD